MTKNNRPRLLSISEKSLWTRVMSAAKPVKNPQGLATFANAPEITHQMRQARAAQVLPLKQNSYAQSSEEKGTSLEAKTSHTAPLEIGKIGETDRRTAQRLKRGKLKVEARLDLHGNTVAQAHDRLLEFLHVSQETGARCVLIVTGKGRRQSQNTTQAAFAQATADGPQPGKLRSAVPRWLNEPAFRPLVLSFSYAVQRDGGEGALYVLLRKRSDRRRSNGGHAR